MIPLAPAITVVPVMAVAIQSLYGITSAVNEYVNKHIDDMTKSDNPTIARTGKVLEGVKYGFGLGYITSFVVIATGQLLLGNSLAAISTVVTAATFANPIAMTCAATGAILYGWKALSDQERNEIIEKLCKGLDVGAELIKAIVNFVVENLGKIFDSENLNEIKKYISSAAKSFGKSLGDVTGKFTDKISDTYNSAKEKTGGAIDKFVEVTSETYDTAKATAITAVDKTGEVTSCTYDRVKGAAEKFVDGAKEALNLNEKIEKDKLE